MRKSSPLHAIDDSASHIEETGVHVGLRCYCGSEVKDESSGEPLGEPFSWQGAEWKLTATVQENSSGQNNHWCTSASLIAGSADSVSLIAKILIPEWSREHFLLVPGLAYSGNRFPSRKIPYPPVCDHPDDFGLNAPTLVGDILRLNNGEGPSGFSWKAGAMAQPVVAWWDPIHRTATWVRTAPFQNALETGFSFSENLERSAAELVIGTPGVRQGTRYALFRNQRDTPSQDCGTALQTGASLELQFEIHTASCACLADLFHLLISEGWDTPEPCLSTHDLPFSAAWDILEDKYQRENWKAEQGYYSVGTGDSRFEDFQMGWVGGGMVTLPLLQLGNKNSQNQAIQAIDFVFQNGGQGTSGFFHGIYHAGVWSGDGFNDPATGQPHPARNHFHLVRKSADGLFYLLRHFDLLRERDSTWQATESWEQGLRRCADAFVRLWTKHGQIGQFLEIHTGVILVGGSASGALAPAALTLAAKEFQESAYLKTAIEIATYYYENFTSRGLTNGGPGEALQCPDSESAIALVEAYLTLWEYGAGDAWLSAAEDAAAQLASWHITYRYEYPPDSEFGRLGLRSEGAIFANSQNGHGAPGLCTHSGSFYLRLYRATGKTVYLRLLQELAHNLTQYLSRKDRPIHTPDGRALPSGWVNERVNTGDWDDNVGGVFYGSTFGEVALMLTCAEIPSIYWEKDLSRVTVFDHLEVVQNAAALLVRNPTNYPCRFTVLTESAESRRSVLTTSALSKLPVHILQPKEECRIA